MPGEPKFPTSFNEDTEPSVESSETNEGRDVDSDQPYERSPELPAASLEFVRDLVQVADEIETYYTLDKIEQIESFSGRVLYGEEKESFIGEIDKMSSLIDKSFKLKTVAFEVTTDKESGLPFGLYDHHTGNIMYGAANGVDKVGHDLEVESPIEPNALKEMIYAIRTLASFYRRIVSNTPASNEITLDSLRYTPLQKDIAEFRSGLDGMLRNGNLNEEFLEKFHITPQQAQEVITLVRDRNRDNVDKKECLTNFITLSFTSIIENLGDDWERHFLDYTIRSGLSKISDYIAVARI